MKRGFLNSKKGRAALSTDNTTTVNATSSATPSRDPAEHVSASSSSAEAKNTAEPVQPAQPASVASSSKAWTIRSHPNHVAPREFSTEPLPGVDARTQAFAGVADVNPGYPIGQIPDAMRGVAGTHVLLNFDPCDGTETIPMWLHPYALKLLKNSNTIEALPDLGGAHRDGEGVNWEIKGSSGAGKGVFALRDFAIGELILIERPLQVMPTHVPMLPNFLPHEKGPETPSTFFKWSNALHQRRTSLQQERYMTLFNEKKGQDDVDDLQGIWRTCQIAVELGDEKAGNYGGVFYAISLMNHSCGPSIHYRQNPASLAVEVRAVRPIKAGEELTFSYLDEEELYSTRTKRRELLRERYKFDCKCQICSLPLVEQKKSNTRRKKLLQVYQREEAPYSITTFATRLDLEPQWWLDDRTTIIQTMEAESLEMYMRKWVVDATIFLVQMGMENEAKSIAERAIKFIIAEEGDGPQPGGLDEIRKMALDPKSHVSFGSTKLLRQLAASRNNVRGTTDTPRAVTSSTLPGRTTGSASSTARTPPVRNRPPTPEGMQSDMWEHMNRGLHLTDEEVNRIVPQNVQDILGSMSGEESNRMFKGMIDELNAANGLEMGGMLSFLNNNFPNGPPANARR